MKVTIAELRRLEADPHVTKAPWVMFFDGGWQIEGPPNTRFVIPDFMGTEQDGRLMVAVRNVLPGLLDTLESQGRRLAELEAENARLRALQESGSTAQHPEILPLVINDLKGRSDQGLKTYGTRLRAHNGRSALRDAYEEALDMAMYLRQVLAEQKNPQAEDK